MNIPDADIILIVNSSIISNPLDFSNSFNEFLCNIISFQNPTNNNFSPRKDLIDSMCKTELISFPFEIYTLICSLKTSQATSFDIITCCVTKKISFHISDVLCCTFNSSIQMGIFTQSLKMEIVLPFHQKISKIV